MEESTQYISDEEYEETEEYVKLNNSEEKNNTFKNYDYIPEKCIKTQLQPIPFNDFNLIERKYKSICKILNGDHPGTGFFCKFNINGRQIKALFTNNHVLDSNRLKIGSSINLINGRSEINIEIKKNRFICSSKNLDYSCIEILPEDNINDFLKIDRQIYEEFMNEYNNDLVIDEYKYQKLILIQYKNFNLSMGNDNIYFSSGFLDKYDGKRIFYRIPIQYGASGAPILSLNNSLDVIGMHRKCGNRKKGILNNGIFFNKILIDIQNKYN